jgi:hypothetical protein
MDLQWSEHAVRPWAWWWWGSMPAFFFSCCWGSTIVRCAQSGRGLAAAGLYACGCLAGAHLPPSWAKSENGSARCGDGRHTLAGARLPLLRASLATAPRGMAVADNPMSACWCAPPTIAGKSRMGSVQCGGNQQAPPSTHTPLSWRGRLLVHASHCRGRVRQQLRMVLWRSTSASSGHVWTFAGVPPLSWGRSTGVYQWFWA